MYSDCFVRAFGNDLDQLRLESDSQPKMIACCIAATMHSFSDAEKADLLGLRTPADKQA